MESKQRSSILRMDPSLLRRSVKPLEEPKSYPTNTEKKGVSSTSDLCAHNSAHIFVRILKDCFKINATNWNLPQTAFCFLFNKIINCTIKHNQSHTKEYSAYNISKPVDTRNQPSTNHKYYKCKNSI